MQPSYAHIEELVAGKLFGDYCSAFPEASRDAGILLRVAVSVGLVVRYEGLLERALRAKRSVPEVEWHALIAQVPWPRPLPEWDRAPIEQWRLDMNPDATPDWPESYIGGCRIGPRHGNPWKRTGLLGRLFDDSPPGKTAPVTRASLRVLAISFCTAVLGLCLPSFDTPDYWVGMAAFLVALVVAGTM